MGQVTETRRVEVASLLERVASWARGRADVRGVALVGSWARDEPGPDSDVDLVVLTDRPDSYEVDAAWVLEAVGQPASVIRTQRWGPDLRERRLRLASGLEVELGFASPAWASTDPIDPGTASVVRDGCRPLVDPGGLLDLLLAAVD